MHDIECKEINDLLTAGDAELAKYNSIAVCEHWLEAWEKIKQVMETRSIANIEDIESLSDWHVDLTIFMTHMIDELNNAAIDEPLYLQKRLEFLQELLERTSVEWLVKDSRRAIGETQFQIGNHAKADETFEGIVRDYPEWGWGYLHWSGCYVYHVSPPNYERAVEIVQMALENADAEGCADAREISEEYHEHMSDAEKVSPLGAKLQRFAKGLLELDAEQALERIKHIKDDAFFDMDAVIAIREQREKAIPLLLEFVEYATKANKEAAEYHEDLPDPMYAMHLLAEFGVRGAFPLFMDILELDYDTCDRILGDVLTDSMGPLIGSVAEKDDIERIKLAIDNTELSCWQRSAAISALIVLNTKNLIGRGELISYLGLLLENYKNDFELASSIVAYCHDLSAREHYPRILELYREDALENWLLSEKNFEIDENLSEEQEAEIYAKRLYYLHPITDTVKAMSGWACFKKEESDEVMNEAFKFFWEDDTMRKTYEKAMAKKREKIELNAKTQYSSTPIVKGAKIGRNEPCPCGSGKKYKKCCLNNML